MPWSLDIHTLDVGVGEASLIIASNPDVSPSKRSILIDGGLSAVAPLVHDAVVRLLPPNRGPDVILVTHYDKDHSGGITDLMQADNLSTLVDLIAGIAEFHTDTPRNDEDPRMMARRVACAALGAMLGSWGAYEGDITNTVMGLDTDTKTSAKTEAGIYKAEAQAGLTAALGAYDEGELRNKALFMPTQKYKFAAETAGVAAAIALDRGDDILTAIHDALFDRLKSLVPLLAQFQTGGIYNEVHIVDIGAMGTPLSMYVPAIQGKLKEGLVAGVTIPGINRRRVGNAPPLGAELFWKGSPPPAPDPPYAVVVSSPNNKMAGRVWQGEGIAAAEVNAGEKENQQSIALVIRFNDFLFYTGGDLPTQGEDLISEALVAEPLPDGAGNLLPDPPLPPPLVAFKAGHHGADTCTSTAMLNRLDPRTAHISCGDSYDHPFVPTLQRLYAAPNLTSVFLTNCRYARRPWVPASPTADHGEPPEIAQAGQAGPVNQWMPGVRARIAGDNAVDNQAPDRLRGDIQINVLEPFSSGKDRWYTTTYIDNYPAPGADPGMVTSDMQRW